MNEVEKMYENAGIKPTKNWQSCLNCKLKTETRYDEWGEEYLTCNRLEMPEKCSDAKEYYPIFTAEKQIELIKWLIQQSFSDERIIRSNFEKTYFYCSYIYDDFCETGPFIKFEEALANVFNYNWQDLTEEERTQIKEILE